MRMNSIDPTTAEIVRVANPRKGAWIELAFLLVYLPLFLGFMFWLIRRVGVDQGFQRLFYFCGIAVASVPILLLLKLTRSTGLQEWTLSRGRLVYKSPSSLLGRSFDVAWSDVRKISVVGDTSFARCELVTGGAVEFYIGNRAGWEFFHAVRSLKEAGDQVPRAWECWE